MPLERTTPNHRMRSGRSTVRVISADSVYRPFGRSLRNRSHSHTAQQFSPILSSGPLDRPVEELRRRHGEHEAETGDEKPRGRASVAEDHVTDPQRKKVKQIGAV